jgi:hypothetical protein
MVVKFPRLNRTDNIRYTIDAAYFASNKAQPFRGVTRDVSPTCHQRRVTKMYTTKKLHRSKQPKNEPDSAKVQEQPNIVQFKATGTA